MTAIKVTLREKIISGGRKSLYLDFYPAIPHPKTASLTRREFLNMYISIDKTEVKKEIEERERNGKDTKQLKELHRVLKPLTPIDKAGNIDTLKIAEAIRQKRVYIN